MKDERYGYIKSLIESHNITRLDQWFPVVPKTKLAKDATLGIDRFNTLISNVGQFTISEMHALAELLDVKYEVIHKMILDQFIQEQEEKNVKVKEPGRNKTSLNKNHKEV
jgi:hypothetical protein